MNAPSRREFFTYAAAATLASALPTRAHSKVDQTKNDTKVRPLVVDVIGPMAFRWSRLSGFDLWMPQLDATTGIAGNEKGNRHESGIMTPVMGFALAKGDYNISGTKGSDDSPLPYPTGNSQIYQAGTSEAPKEYFIHISLPLPFHIVLLQPEPAKIWSNGNKPSKYTNYAAGLRLLYPDAGLPSLSPHAGTSLLRGAPKDGAIQFDPAPAENQLDMSITYSPINAGAYDDAYNSFRALAKLLKLDLQIEFPEVQDATLHRPCRSAVVQLNAST